MNPSRFCRALRLARAAASLTLSVLIALPWALLPRRSPVRRMLELLGWRIVLGGFGVEVRVTGAPHAGAILAVNHISWADISVLAALCPATFVAKKEIEDWPILGALARRHGCIFVDRGTRSLTGTEVQQLGEVARTGRGAVLFAEATTSDGFSVRPFKSSLFEAACQSGALIAPVAITYRNRDGSPQSPAQRRLVAWLDDDSLLPHALELAAAGGVIAEVHFGEPVLASNRKDAARKCREAIMQRLGLADIPNQAAMRNLAA